MDQNECFICFDISNQYEKTPSRLNILQDYIKNCACDGWVHNICVEKWYNNHETCPICRKKMLYLNFELHYLVYLTYYFVLIRNYIYIFIQQLLKLRNFIFFCVVITNIMNIVTIALHNFDKNNMCSDYDYMYEYNYTYYYPKYIYNAPQIL